MKEKIHVADHLVGTQGLDDNVDESVSINLVFF